MPPSGFKTKAVKAAIGFVGACYEDLLAEVKSGKHPDMKTAIEHELGQIRMSLKRAHITPKGKLVQR